MSVPRGLSAEEAEEWARLAATVKPLPGRIRPARPMSHGPVVNPHKAPPEFVKPPPRPVRTAPAAMPMQPSKTPAARPRPIGQGGLDSHWDKRLRNGAIAPDFTLDLHGHTLEEAHLRLDRGMRQALAMGARLILVVTGKPRPVDAADRATRRGAIRAKILDWLAAGPHADAIAAIRKSHQRHGGDGALYIVLRRS